MDMKIITAFLSIMLVVAATACERSEVNGIGSYTPDAAHPPQLDVTIDDCRAGEWGWVHGTGTITNTTDDVATYEVVVAFVDGAVRLDEGSDWTRDLNPGASARFEASTWLGERASRMTTCSALTVNRWGARTISETERSTGD